MLLCAQTRSQAEVMLLCKQVERDLTLMSVQYNSELEGWVGKEKREMLYFFAHIFIFSIFVDGIGVVVRIASTTTESVYRFLQHQLAGMEPLVGSNSHRRSINICLTPIFLSCFEGPFVMDL
ncbi:hypothetical protein QQP08_009101 [Theobroma cacao]|nr:hypothetical protein QQP08_009101 [Theobroma cacao]